MESIDRKAKAKSFVRRYSFKVAADLPENELAQLLMENQSIEIARKDKKRDGIVVEFNQWLCAESQDSLSEDLGNEDLRLLLEERNELAETWLKFQTKYPEYSELLPDIREPPSIDGLRSIMRSTAQDWDKKRHDGFGRAKERIIEFSESLVSFSDLFSIIPDGDKYVSLFTGVVSTTIKAAARHKEIAEGFSSALEKIGKEMNFSTHELKVHRTKRMERLVIRLYIRHAKFFCHFMNWYLSSSFTRFAISLRNDFYTKEVEQRVTEIRSVAKEIEQEASLITQRSIQRTEAKIWSLGLTMEELARRADLYHNMNIDRHETIDERLELLARQVGQLSRDHIVAHCDNLLYKTDVADTIGECLVIFPVLQGRFHSMSEPELAACRHGLVTRRDEGSQPSNSPADLLETSDIQHSQGTTLLSRVLVFTRPRLQKIAQDLQRYFPSPDPGESGHGSRNPGAPTVSGLIVGKFREWLASPSSEFLWILGANSPCGNEATLATSHILNIAMSATLPYVSFTCTPLTTVPNTSEDGKTRCVALLVALLYSLIHQLLCVVPETFEEVYELEDSIQTLNGGEDSIERALEIVQVLLRHRTPLLVVILDGLELLEDDHTVPHLRKLISIIHSRQTDSRLKVLLGSQGSLESGVDLDVDERVDCAMLPKRRPGRAQPDGRFLGELDSFHT